MGNKVRRKRVQYRAVPRQPVLEEKIPLHWRGQEEVVVEVYEMFCKSGDSVHHKFNRIGRKDRQIFLRDVVGVPHPVQFWRVEVQPVRFLPASDEMHRAHPRREFLHATKPVAQKPVVAVAFFRAVDVEPPLLWGILVEFRNPFRVASVHPRNHKINVEILFHVHLENYLIWSDFWLFTP